jgi:L-threonylcarbamoyladenylate synthase
MKVLKSLDEAADLIKAGKVGVIPSDTIYGIVADASNMQAVSRIYELKQRDGKPGTIIAANIEQLVQLGIKKRYLTAVEHFWPNPISVVIPCFELDHLHHGMGSVPVRIPKDAELPGLLAKTGALQTSSANITGKPGANTIREAIDYFGEQVDFYVDGGDLSNNKPSTVIRIVDDAVEVIRDGAVKIDEETGRIIDEN